MKKTKIIIPALGILLLSTAASVSGTVAWFSMNKTVTATGMSVTAKSDSSFLLIGTSEQTLSQIQTANAISASAVTPTASLYPAAHTDAVTNYSTANEPGNWYFEYSLDPTKSTEAGVTQHTALNTTGVVFSDYVLINTFRITVAAGGKSVNNLKVESITIDVPSGGVDAVNVIVASSTAMQEFAAGAEAPSSYTTLAASVTNSAYVEVSAFIYWNGAHAGVYTNNVANLLGTSVEIEFTYESVANS